jgi:hypothetical protein
VDESDRRPLDNGAFVGDAADKHRLRRRMHRNEVIDWATKQARELVLQYDHPQRTLIATEMARRMIEAYVWALNTTACAETVVEETHLASAILS